MDRKANDKPPIWILIFFRWFCHPECREDIEGDLLERFHNRVTILGGKKAKWLLIKDVLLLIRPGLTRGFYNRSQQKIINMQTVNWKRILGLNLVVVLMIVSPFIPGPSNKLVGVFSFVGQLMGICGLLLVPVGLTWTIIEIRKLRATPLVNREWHYHLAIAAMLLIALAFLAGVLFLPNPMPKISCLFGLLLMLSALMLALRKIKKWDAHDQAAGQGAPVILASAATACISFMYLFSSLAVFVLAGIVPGISALLLLFPGLYWVLKQIRKLKEDNKRKINPVPIYLLTLPLSAFLTWMFVMEPASGFSRRFAIKRSESLIASIEDFKSKTGHYPESIGEIYSPSSKKIPKPFIMGIGDFRYNKINDNYSLSFSQWLDLGSLEEIVLYDKNNIAKKSDLLPPYDYKLDLHRVKGAFATYDTRQSNWRYYHLD